MNLHAEAARQRARIEGAEMARIALSTTHGAIECVLAMNQPEAVLAFLLELIFNGNDPTRAAIEVTQFWVDAKAEEAMENVDLTEYIEEEQ